MDKAWLDKTIAELSSALSSKFNLGADEIKSLSVTCQNSLSSGIKSFVMKNGSKELEDLMLGQKTFETSSSRQFLNTQLRSDIEKMSKIDAVRSGELATHTIDFMMKSLCSAFQNSNHSKDTDGICAFLGIDKNLLKMVNSPMGKMFGKFM